MGGNFRGRLVGDDRGEARAEHAAIVVRIVTLPWVLLREKQINVRHTNGAPRQPFTCTSSPFDTCETAAGRSLKALGIGCMCLSFDAERLG